MKHQFSVEVCVCVHNLLVPTCVLQWCKLFVPMCVLYVCWCSGQSQLVWVKVPACAVECSRAESELPSGIEYHNTHI